MKGYIEKRPNGTWRAKIYLGMEGGKQRYLSKTFKLRKDAQAWLNKTLAEMESGSFVRPEKITVSEWAEEWLEHHAKHTVRPQTLMIYRQSIGMWTKRQGDMLLKDVTPRHINNWQSTLIDEGYSPATIHKFRAVVGRALRDACTVQVISRNPSAGVKRPSKLPPAKTCLSKEQALAFIEASKGTGSHTLLYIGIATGMRWGECQALMWEDVDLKGGSIRIRRGWNERIHAMGPPKTKASNRVIMLSPEAIEVLTRHRKSALEGTLRGDVQEPEYVWQARERSARDRVRADMDKICKTAGVPHVTFHELRHTHATLLMQANVSPKVVSERLGHASVQMTLDVYSHVLKEIQGEAVAAITSILSPHAHAMPTEGKRNA